MLALIEPGATVVVWRLDRLGRNFRDLVDIAEELRTKGANLVSLSEGIDTSSSIGEVVYRLMIVFADFERKIISERTTAGLVAAKARGVRLGRRHKLPELERQKVLQDLDAGDAKADVMRRYGIGRTTLYRYSKL